MPEIKRFLDLPKRSFLLLGPRGTGKSTIIRQKVNFQLEIDLLKSKFFLPLSKSPSELEFLVSDLKKEDFVFIDEVQKIPSLMDEVHSLYESRKLHFALSGSSARKLKRSGANLLAGRALSLSLFPFTYYECNNHLDLRELFEWGSLPQVVNDKTFKEDYLYSYVQTYLKEELLQEGLIRKLEPFSRFLSVAGLYHGQTLNASNIARESHVSRSTVEKYLEILEDTQLSFSLRPLQKKWNKKEVSYPKFYLFDSGVARACAGLLRDPLDSVWLGYSFESVVVNEIKAYNYYLKFYRPLYYYRYNGGYEVDLLIETKKKTLQSKAAYTAIEIKSSKRWDSRWSKPLLDLKEKSKGEVTRIIAVYAGDEILHLKEGLCVYPIKDFLLKLTTGELYN